MTPVERKKYFVFGDESGSWHDPREVYVRAWVITSESDSRSLAEAVCDVIAKLGCGELKWSHIAHNPSHFEFVSKCDFRIFLTVSSPADINWEQKYKITRDFNTQVEGFDFGELGSELISVLKKKMYDDIRNLLFLNFYEKTHIENAKKGIDSILPSSDNLLIFRIDPPQMSKTEWANILRVISPEVEVEFPHSQSSEGIQFAGVVAGCVRSFLLPDSNVEAARAFIPHLRGKLVSRSRTNPNPNLIFFKEVNEDLKNRCGEIWSC